MDSKGLVSPERWRGFCNEVVPLLLTEKFCWTEGETLTARVKVAHYGARSLQGTELAWTLRDEQGHVAGKGVCPIVSSGRGLLEVGDIRQPIPVTGKARRLNLELAIEGTDYKNTYPLWFYPENRSAEESHPGITVVKRLDGHVLSALENGGKVLWFPERDCYASQTVGGLFQTDYWNYRMFETISRNNRKPVSPGTMGLLTAPGHPLFRSFPTDFHTNWQWFPIVKQSYPLVLDHFPKGYRPIVQVIDNIERNHKLGLIFELAVGKGKLLVCMSDLEAVDDKPEVRQLYRSMLDYMESGDFNPKTAVSSGELVRLLQMRPEETKREELRNISFE